MKIDKLYEDLYQELNKYLISDLSKIIINYYVIPYNFSNSDIAKYGDYFKTYEIHKMCCDRIGLSDVRMYHHRLRFFAQENNYKKMMDFLEEPCISLIRLDIILDYDYLYGVWIPDNLIKS